METCGTNIPNAFTPNGDGINEVWKIAVGSCVKRLSVKVFNRYGSPVYQSDNYQNDWAGKYKGNPCPDGTYYYVVEIFLANSRNQVLKGNVTILR